MGRKPLDVEKIVFELINNDDMAIKKKLAKKISDIAYKKGIYLSSIQELYVAKGKGEVNGFTVPAINLRSMAYDLARAIFKVAKKNNSGAFIFEIAKSEMGYTNQPPVEYSAVILAAAIKEGYVGPVFVQGDHFQVNAKKYKEDPEKELESLKTLITEAIEAGFYNIDIDSSMVVYLL